MRNGRYRWCIDPVPRVRMWTKIFGCGFRECSWVTQVRYPDRWCCGQVFTVHYLPGITAE
jgi:hypothetical protein